MILIIPTFALLTFLTELGLPAAESDSESLAYNVINYPWIAATILVVYFAVAWIVSSKMLRNDLEHIDKTNIQDDFFRVNNLQPIYNTESMDDFRSQIESLPNHQHLLGQNSTLWKVFRLNLSKNYDQELVYREGDFAVSYLHIDWSRLLAPDDYKGEPIVRLSIFNPQIKPASTVLIRRDWLSDKPKLPSRQKSADRHFVIKDITSDTTTQTSDTIQKLAQSRDDFMGAELAYGVAHIYFENHLYLDFIEKSFQNFDNYLEFGTETANQLIALNKNDY